jgi:hypothetical protein
MIGYTLITRHTLCNSTAAFLARPTDTPLRTAACNYNATKYCQKNQYQPCIFHTNHPTNLTIL